VRFAFVAQGEPIRSGQAGETSRALDPELLAARRPGWSLPGEFYRDTEIYRQDMNASGEPAGCLPDTPAR